MNIDHIREFLIVAECLSFSEAAKVSFLSISAISRHINIIETELGYPLFQRNNHKLMFTSKGLDFYDNIKPVIIEYDKVVGEATQYDKADVLTLGIHYAEWHKKTFEYIKKFSDKNPDIKLEIINTTNHDFPEMLKTKQIDIAMEYFTDAHQQEDLSCVKLEMERFVVAYSSLRDLEKTPLNIDSLKNEVVFLPDTKKHPGSGEVIKLIENINIITISNTQKCGSLNEVFLNVALDKGLTIIPEEYTAIIPEGINTLYFEGLPIRPTTALFRKNDKNTNISKFVSFLKSIKG